MKFFFSLLISSLSLVSFAQSASDPQYEVPLKNYRISGSYGELRGNHYHAGLDMGTAGVENVDVLAAEDGWVSRVKVGPYGYGRALYIDHPDGHTTVYGHLNGFAPKIDSLVRSRQYASRSFDVEFFPAKDAVKVSRGEVVAYSGNTGGSGGPHLHFEVRDTRTEEPLNPMRFIRVAPDNVPPTLYGVKVYALSADAQVAGASADKYLNLQSIKGKTIDCVGEIGLGIHCTDYVEAGGRPCGIIEICLFDGDSLVYRSRVDHFPFSLNKDVNSHIDYEESILRNRYIQRSFVEPGNLLPIYSTVSTPTLVREGETHNMRYVVKDFAGNVSQISFTLRGRRNAGAKARTKPSGYFIPRLRTWSKDTLGVDVLVPRETFFSDTYLTISRTDRSTAQPPVFSIGSRTVPIKKSVTLTMAVPDAWKGLGSKVFIGRRSGGWLAYQGGEMRRASDSSSIYVISAKVSQLGDYTIGVDSIAPSVSISNKSNVLRQSDWVYIRVSDDVSGVSKYSVTIDGQWHVFEYDYKKNRLKAQLSYLGIKAGSHKLHAVVTDACGNAKSLDWSFVVR